MLSLLNLELLQSLFEIVLLLFYSYYLLHLATSQMEL